MCLFGEIFEDIIWLLLVCLCWLVLVFVCLECEEVVICVVLSDVVLLYCDVDEVWEVKVEGVWVF